MSFFRFRWLRTRIRKHTSPIPKDTATFWKERLSKIYLVLAVNITGLILYQTYTKDLSLIGDSNMPTEAKYRKLAQGQEIEVIQVKGFQIANKYTLPPADQPEEHNQ